MLPASDLIVLPGGFSYGDYLRCGAMAAHSPVMREVVARARAGTPVLGICNGFQMLTEAGLLPGALMRNATLNSSAATCSCASSGTTRSSPAATSAARSSASRSPTTTATTSPTTPRCSGSKAKAGSLSAIASAGGAITAQANPNGSRSNIAGIYNETGTVLGLMPHPERARRCRAFGGTDGAKLFLSLVETLH